MNIIHEFLAFFRIVFTAPSFTHFSRLIEGFITQSGCKSVTELNRSHQSEHHFSTIYDFLKKGKWSHESLSKALFIWFMTTLNRGQRLILAIDDTKQFKPHAKVIPGLCWHADHHRLVKTSVKDKNGEELTATGVVGQNGHCWVALSALLALKPGKWCCFPLKAELFVREKHAGKDFKTKHELGLKMLKSLCSSIRPLLVGDNFYGSKDFVNSTAADVLSLLKSNAVAYERPEQQHSGRGRPKKYGRKIKLAEELDQPERLKSISVEAYGKTQQVQYAEFMGLLRGHQRPVKIILVKGMRKSNFLLFTNDRKLSAKQMIEYYAARFQIEITFRELKQEMGAFNYRLRSMSGIMRYVHLSFVAYVLLKYLAIQEEVKPRQTDWYAPEGLASPRQVQRAVSDKIQAFRIFRNLLTAGYLRKNISYEMVAGLCAS